MKKFSKKIAMMMVLAMLVSMFSGIVSASAASIWSAKSVDDDHYAVVMGETIEVKKGEFINFDLFKADVEATEAGYEYTWESSDPEVLFIVKEGKNNGYARVKGEVGDEATITVNFKNLATGKDAERSFDVVVVEELEADVVEEVEYAVEVNFGEEAFVVGEEYELEAVAYADDEAIEAEVAFFIGEEEIEDGVYAPTKAETVIITVVVYVDGEAVATGDIECEVIEAVASEIIAAKQKDAKTVELTFDAAITAEEAAKIELFLGSVAKNNYKKKVTVKDNVVTYESIATFGNNKTWTFIYGDSKIDLTSSQGEVAKVVIDGPEIFYLKKNGVLNNPAKIKYTCYDKNDVMVTMPADAYITWDVKGDATLGDADIIFAEAGKSATISGVYHTGKFDEKSNQEITIDIAPYEVTSADNNDATMQAFSQTGVTVESKEAKYGKYDIPVNKTGYVHVEFLFSDATKVVPGKLGPNQNGLDDKGNQIVTFESTATDKLIVDPKDGQLIPLKEGKVDVLVKVNGEDFDLVTVEIVAAEVAKAPSVSVSANQISNSTALNQYVAYKATGTTQYNNKIGYKITNIEVVSDPFDKAKEAEAELKTALKNGAFFGPTGTEEVKVYANAQVGSGCLKTGNYVFKLTIKADDGKEFTQNVSVFVRQANATTDDIASIGVEFVNSNGVYDTAATKATENFDAKVNIRFIGKNSAGVAVRYIDPTAVSSSIEIKIGSSKQDYAIDKDGISVALYTAKGGKYSVSGAAVTGVSYTAIKDGDYTITGKIDGKTIPNTKFVVKNTQAAPALSLTDNGAKLEINAGEDLMAKLATCYKALEGKSGEYSYGDIKVTAVTASDNAKNAVAGEYYVVITKAEVYQTFNAGAVVKHELTLAQPITLTVK